jgi:adenylate cyclase
MGDVTAERGQDPPAGQDAPAGQVLQVRLLGPFSVSWAGRTAGPWPRPSARRLCELVLASPGRRISRDRVCEELFGNLDPHAAARSVSRALSMARATLAGLGGPASGLLEADLDHIWATPVAEVDADVTEHALRTALGMAPGRDRDDRLVAALADDADLLADEPYTDWALAPRERLNALRQEARLTLARDRAKGAGQSRPAAVTQAWESCFEHDPACEEAAAALMRDYLGQGRRELAVRTHERCAEALAALGLTPSRLLAEVYAAVATSPAVVGAVPAAASISPAAAAISPATVAGTPAAGAAPASPREELRTVSVLVAEVAAPAGLAGRLGPERFREVVGGSLAAVIAEVEAFGGTVISVSGGGLQAVFGAPQAHEDDPERAARAAFRALSATGDPAPGGSASRGSARRGSASAGRVGAAPALRIGVETGTAVLGPIGGGAKVEYGAVGEVVGIAAALQSSATPGTVLVGPATRAATGHLFTWGATEELALDGGIDGGVDGGAEPLIGTYLGRPRAGRTGRRLGFGLRGPLAGRQAEMAVLGGALRDAANGRGSVVILTGEPGVGKTRLVQECRRRFMALAWPEMGPGAGTAGGRPPLWLEGRCASFTSATPYGLYRQLLANWAGVAPEEPEPVLRLALERALTAWTGSRDQFPLLARMMGVSPGMAPGRMSPEEHRRATFAAVSSVVSRLLATGPAVLSLEDLHWADPTSFHLTWHLARLAADRPLLVLLTSRPEAGPELARIERCIPAGLPVHHVVLGPLAGEAERELARSLIGDDPGQEVLDTVLASVEGNPLFLEERLSSLLETRAIVRQQGRWRLGESAEPEVPVVLERLVRSRVDRLSPAAREVIRPASVLGLHFPLSLLTAVCAADQPLGPAVDELRARDLLQEVTGGPEPAFRFRHALIQEATYEGLLGAERRLLHSRAAWALEAASAGRLEEVAAVLGRHFAAAGEDERAITYLEMAGDHATDAFANDEAVTSFRAALDVVYGQPARSGIATTAAVRLNDKLANVLWRTGRRGEAREAFADALRLGDPAEVLQRAHLLIRLGRLEMAEHHFAAAVEAFDAAEALFTGDPAEQDDATVDKWLELMLDGRADLYAFRGEHERAMATLEAVRPVLDARGTPARRCGFYHVLALGRVVHRRYRVDETDIANIQASLAAAAQGEDEKDVGYATYFVGWLLWLHDNLAGAQQHVERALALAERIGEAILLAESLLMLVLIALRRRDTQTVRSVAPRAMAAAEGMASSGYVASVKACLAWLAWQDRRPSDVVALSGQVAELRATFTCNWVYLWPLIAVCLDDGDLAGAVAGARQLLDPAQQRLPDDLESTVEAACGASDRHDPEACRLNLAAAVALARNLRYL